MKIVIVGAGAMGSRFGFMLKQAGQDVALIDGWDKNVEALQKDGIIANYNGEEIQQPIEAYHEDAVDPELKADLLIIFTKAMQLEATLQKTQAYTHNETRVLCLLNGIGYEDILRRYFDEDQIIIGNTMWTAGLEGPGRPKLFGDGSVNLLNLGKSDAAVSGAHEVIDIFNEAGLNGVYEKGIFYLIYKKLCVNGTMNGLCSLLECNMAELGATEANREIVQQLVSEIVAIAQAEDVEMSREEMIAHVEECYNPETIGLHYPSMYQDLIKNNRSTEIDFINGAIADKGKKYGIATPYNDLLTRLIHTKEELLGAK